MDGGKQDVPAALPEFGQGKIDVRIFEYGQDAANLVIGRGGQAGLRVAAMLVELALEEAVDVALVARRQSTALNEKVCQGRVLVSGPGGAGLGKLVVVEQVRLEGEHAEKKVVIGIHRAPRCGKNRPRYGRHPIAARCA